MSATADPRGLKRICMNCGARFYDLNKNPIICPSCHTEFTGEIKVKARRGRATIPDDTKESQIRHATANDDEDDGPILDDDEDDVVSLDDLDEDEDDLEDDLDDLDPNLDDIDEIDEDNDDSDIEDDEEVIEDEDDK